MRFPILVTTILLAACWEVGVTPTDRMETATTFVAAAPNTSAASLAGATIAGEHVVSGAETLGSVSAIGPPQATRGSAATSLTPVCWYLVTYIVQTGEIISVEFLFCTDGGQNCTSEQTAIAAEYDDVALYSGGGSGGARTSTS